MINDTGGDRAARSGAAAMMNWDGSNFGSMMGGMGLIWLVVLAFLVLGIAAFIKYLRK